MLEETNKARFTNFGSRIKRPNPFAIVSNMPKEENEKNYDISQYKNLLGSKIVQGDTKTQFRIRPQTPKLDMILLQKAQRNKLK
jgi:hypothetical protein